MPDSLEKVLPPQVRGSFALKFLVIGGIVVVLVAAIGSLTFVQTERQLGETTQSQLESTATARAETLSGWADSLQTDAALLTESDAISNGDLETVAAYLRDKQGDGALDQSVMALHYLDTTEPEILASSNENFVGVNPQAEGVPWAQGGVDIQGDQPIISDAFPGPRVNQPVVAVIAPIESKQNRALVLMVNVGARSQRLPEAGQQTNTRVVNSDGTIVMSHRSDEILTQNADPQRGVESPVIEGALAGERGYAERTHNGTTTAIGYAPVDGVDWVVTTRTPKRAAFAIQRTITRNIALLLGVSIAGFLVVGLAIGRPTANVLEELSTTAEAIASGEIDTEVPESNREDELGDVQAAFRETQSYISTVGRQVAALSDQRFDSEVFEQEVPGPLGDAIVETRTDLRSFISDIESARDDAEAARREAETMAAELNEQAVQFQAVMAHAANGDLTQRLDTETEYDSMAAIAASTNEMLEELETTVRRVRQFAGTVDGSAESICASAEEIETTSHGIATTTQEIAEGTEQQDDLLDEAAGEVGDLSATVEEIAASSNEVAGQSSTAADLGREGCHQATAAADEISAIADRVETVADEVGRLDDEMERIGDIVDLIDDIAQQTNLLALNANIEAAHARGSGNGGDGFAVVAEEVKTLSAETSEQTEEIESIIRDVQESTGELATDMREARERMLAGADSVEETKDLFEDVVEHVEEANDGIHAINEATDEQASATTGIVTMVDDVSEISARTADDTGDLAAAAEEQTASISTVTERIVDLAEMAEQLESLTSDFDVSETDDSE